MARCPRQCHLGSDGGGRGRTPRNPMYGETFHLTPQTALPRTCNKTEAGSQERNAKSDAMGCVHSRPVGAQSWGPFAHIDPRGRPRVKVCRAEVSSLLYSKCRGHFTRETRHDFNNTHFPMTLPELGCPVDCLQRVAEVERHNINSSSAFGFCGDNGNGATSPNLEQNVICSLTSHRS